MPTSQNLRTWLQIVDKNQNRKCLFLATSSLFGKKLMSRRFDVKCHLLCFIRCLQAKIDIFHTLYTSENLKTSMYGNTSCVRNLWSIVRSLCWIKHLKERCVLRQSKPNMRPKSQLGMWYLHVTLVNANYELWNIRSSLEQKNKKVNQAGVSNLSNEFLERIKSIFTHLEWIYQHLDVCCWSTWKYRKYMILRNVCLSYPHEDAQNVPNVKNLARFSSK